jgi:hydroxyacylglutathione hydrolase
MGFLFCVYPPEIPFMKIRIFSAFEDNYIYLLEDEKGNAILVDPAESRSVLPYLEQHPLNLKIVLITHSHADHTGGLEQIKRQTGCLIVGPHPARIPMQDVGVQDGQVLDFSYPIRVLSTPGHTPDSVCYFIKPPSNEPPVLFTGDTLFINGCGRMMGSRPQEFRQSLQKLSALPPETRLYCGHEYTEENCRFALTLEPDNARLRQQLEIVREQIRKGQPTVPSTIGQEKECNPFLRADSPSIRRALSMLNEPAWQVFAELRTRKDRF